MGRPPNSGGPAFRFSAPEVAEMEDILKEHHNTMPPREFLVSLSEKFSNSSERQGKIVVQMKQVWNWFQNKRYAIRAKTAKAPAKLSVSTLPPAHLTPVQSTLHPPPIPRNDFAPQINVAQAVSGCSGKIASDNSAMEFEAKSTRDGAWYDVAHFLSVRNLESGDPEVLVRFAGFGPEEDEWLNVKKLVRQRSLPCESSECVAVLPGDLILCFQEGKEQALYYDAHVLDAQRRYCSSLPFSHVTSLSSIMPSDSRWTGLYRHRSTQISDNFEVNGNISDDEIENARSNTMECYACTHVGIPAFHSTSCDRANQPEYEASAGTSLVPIHSRSNLRLTENRSTGNRKPVGTYGRVLDPRIKMVQKWNRAFLLARGLAIAVDPLFFYALSIGRGGSPCLYMDGSWAAIVTVLRTCIDAVHLCRLWLQFRLAYVSRESLVVGCGKLVWDPTAIAAHYLRSVKGFWFDVFVILPVPQAAFWLIVPKLIREERIKLIMTLLLLIFLFQFLPKIYHSICLMRQMQKVTGYIFGTIWWGFALNLIAYFIASHVAGGCWYVLAIQRVASCLKQQCDRKDVCNLSLACSKEVCYQFLLPQNTLGSFCGRNSTMTRMPLCLDAKGPFRYGIYKWALPVISSNSISVKILYPIFWGLMTLSTFGNDLEPTSNWLEVSFSICIVLAGLMLFTLLIGNIQVFLHAVMAKKRSMQLKCRDMEWWMRRRQLPSKLRKRVRHFERQRWAVMGGEDEMEMIKDLPEGLRRDIKRYLCLDLIKKVPLFQHLDNLILDNICDRVRPLYYSKDEKIIREGDPVQRMVFIVRGRIKSSQNLSKGMVATSMLEPGGFLGDELLSWCLRRPFMDRLPASSATFVSAESTEAFGLEANHLKYITDHFRYKFANERLKRTARYYSSHWRTWAAVNVQLAWRRYMMRTRGPVIRVVESEENGGSERRLLQYAAMFMSIRPHDHLE